MAGIFFGGTSGLQIDQPKRDFLPEHSRIGQRDPPFMVTLLVDWIKNAPKGTLDKFHIDPKFVNHIAD
jgi:hypothetical protein